MVEAIVYTSNAGHTQEYAHLLGAKTALPVYELGDGMKQLKKGTSVLYLGWLMAGKIKGLPKAGKHFSLPAVCGVGMAKTGSQLVDVAKSNAIPAGTKVFTLQGGYEPEKLHGIYKLMMSTMQKTAGKGLADKKNRTPEEDEMLALFTHGGNMVREENLTEVLAWMQG